MDYYGRMAGRGKGGASGSSKSQYLLPGGMARQKYLCNMCQTPIISYDMKTHYKSITNWEQLKKLQMGVEENNVIEELGDIGYHTYYMYKNGYTKNRWPSYLTQVLTLCTLSVNIMFNTFFL